MIKSNELAVLILAAGTSSRLGEPKQLVKYKDETLLAHACKKACDICSDVFVVLGAKKEECEKEIRSLDVNILENQNYEEGLSSSIKAGISNLINYEKVLVLLCDQPFISSKHLKNLIEKSKQSEKIVCSFYKNDVAVPAIFPKKHFEDLLELNGDKGAKKVIKQSLHEAVLLNDKYAIDIDKKEDKKYLI